MTSPLISFVTYTNSPDRVEELCKFFDEYEFPISWELIIGVDTTAAFGERWIRIKHITGKSPNVTLHQFDLPAEKTTGDRLQLLFNQSKGFYFCIIEHDYLPTPDFIEFTKDLKEENKVHIGSMINEEGELRIPSIDRGFDFYQASLFPRGLILFPRTSLTRLGGINKHVNHGVAYDLVCRMFVVNEEFALHSNAFTLAPHLHEMSSDELEELGKIGHGYFYALINKDLQMGGLMRADVVLPGQVVLDDKHVELQWDGDTFVTTEGFSVPDQHVGILRCADVLNRISPDKIMHFMEEAWRVLAKDGWLITTTPSSNGSGGFSDPRNVSFWNQNSFGLFCLNQEQEIAKQFNGVFEHTRVWESFPSTEYQQANYLLVYAELRRLEKAPPS